MVENIIGYSAGKKVRPDQRCEKKHYLTSFCFSKSNIYSFFLSEKLILYKAYVKIYIPTVGIDFG